MINTNLAYEYINDIPWEKHPAFAFSDDTNNYLQAFRNQIDVVPVGDMKISFDDDIWDFNPYIKDIVNDIYKISFSAMPKEIRDYAKFFTLYKIMGKTKISSINVRLKNATSLLNGIIENTNHNSIYLITTQDIINEIKRRDVGASMTHNFYEAIFQFYTFLESNYKLELPVDTKQIKKLGIEAKNKSKKNKEETKIPDIPSEYFNAILQKSIEIMRDPEAEHNRRATACMVIILSQTGLRSTDALALKKSQLYTKTLAKIDKETNYIHYTARKPSKTDNNLLEFDIFCNELCAEAYKTLIGICHNCKVKNKENYIYAIDSQSTKELPVKITAFRNEFRKLLYKELPEYSLKQWEGVGSYKHKTGKTKFVNISVPDARQFRVHLCTELYEKGVSLTYIQKYMGHLSEYMLGYYVRPKDTYQENIKYSEKVIKEIVEDDINLLGHENASEIKENIKKFIEQNNLNVEEDIEAVINAFGDKIVIRGKTGGVCIKTSLVPCSKDMRTNELMCAYNLCPNLFHMYYMIDITYLNYLTLVETHTKLTEKGNKREAQKELNKLKNLINNKLLTELNELEAEIKKNGKEKILTRYPSLTEIAENITDIRKEALTWLN